jgi:hypothetical protein
MVYEYEIRKERTKAPAQNDLIWAFCVDVKQPDGITSAGITEQVEHHIADTELQAWATEVLGRSLDYKNGQEKELEDLLANWDRLEPKIRSDVERSLGRKLRS